MPMLTEDQRARLAAAVERAKAERPAAPAPAPAPRPPRNAPPKLLPPAEAPPVVLLEGVRLIRVDLRRNWCCCRCERSLPAGSVGYRGAAQMWPALRWCVECVTAVPPSGGPDRA